MTIGCLETDKKLDQFLSLPLLKADTSCQQGSLHPKFTVELEKMAMFNRKIMVQTRFPGGDVCLSSRVFFSGAISCRIPP